MVKREGNGPKPTLKGGEHGIRLASATRLSGQWRPVRGGSQMSRELGLRRLGILAGALILLTACGGTSTSTSSTSAANAKSAADVGGMDALIAAAKKEGTLNVIAPPPDWANHGGTITAFQNKYGIHVNSAAPNDSSQQEVDAIGTLAGTTRAPDVVDVGMAVALKNVDRFAPYQVATWSDIAASSKEPPGLWAQA